MKLKSTGLKWLRFLHLISAGIWFGGAVCVGGLAVFCFLSGDPQTLSAGAPFIPKLFANLISYMAIFTLIQGFIYGFFTNWGFFKYRWLLLKWILVVAIIPFTATSIMQTGAAIRHANQGMFENAFASGESVLLLIACQIVILLVIMFLSVFKPGRKNHSDKQKLYNAIAEGPKPTE